MRKHFIIYIILIIIICSCDTKQPKCASSDSKELLRGLVEKKVKRNDYINLLLSKEEYFDKNKMISSFTKDIKFKHVRKVSQDKELKRCKCKAEMVMDLDKVFNKNEKFYKRVKNDENVKIVENFIADIEIPLSYTLQKTSEGQIYIESKIPEEVLSLAEGYIPIKNIFEKMSIVENKKNEKTINEGETPNFKYDNSKWDYCYALEEKNHTTILNLKELSENRIKGVYDLIPHIDMGSWGGKINGTYTNSEKTKIEAKGKWESEGITYTVKLEINLSKEKAIIIDLKNDGHYSNKLEKTTNCIKTYY